MYIKISIKSQEYFSENTRVLYKYKSDSTPNYINILILRAQRVFIPQTQKCKK